MEEIFTSSNSANATSITMILLLLCLIIKEFAGWTEVFTHAYTTVFAHLLHILLMIAKRAYNPCNKVSGHFMALWRNRLIHILDLIVAMTTVKDFITAGGSDATPPSVVWTPAKCHDHLSEIFQLGVSGSLTL
jgi:hypothetical protein